ncbi:MAG TPA: hypothetical protein VHY35_02265 [Stellaceae bacterium]|jgi:hypothetical protein|nr:hypothetical protein [Stellaceae bacterium]
MKIRDVPRAQGFEISHDSVHRLLAENPARQRKQPLQFLTTRTARRVDPSATPECDPVRFGAQAAKIRGRQMPVRLDWPVMGEPANTFTAKLRDAEMPGGLRNRKFVTPLNRRL